MIHLAHDLGGATVLIFGGGRVGARRARTLDEARVVVLSPEFADDDFGDASLVRAVPDADDARALIARAEPALVVLATDDAGFNEAVAEAARSSEALVNRADRPAAGFRSVDVPATARDGPVVASVSTGGRSPVLSAHLRDLIADDIEGSGEMAELTADLRTELRDRGVPIDRRREALRGVVSAEGVWRAIRNGDDARAAAAEAMAGVDVGPDRDADQ